MVTEYIQKLRLFGRDVWLYLAAWSLVGFAYLGIFMVLFNLYLLRLGYGPEFIGLVNGVGLFALAIFSIPSGALGRKWGSRRMMIIGMALMTIGFTAVPLAELVPASWQRGWFLVTWSVVSFSAPLYTVNAMPFLMSVTGPEERNYAFSMQAALFSLAGFAGGMMAGFLPGIFSGILAIPTDLPAPFRYPLFFAGALMFVGLLLTIAMREGEVEQEQSEKSSAMAGGPIPLVLITVMAIVMLLRVTGEWAPNVFYNVYLATELRTSTAFIGSSIAAGRLVAGVAALSMPLAVKQWGKERVIGWGTIGVALCLLPLALIPQAGVAAAGFVGAIALTTLVNGAFFVYSQELVSPSWRAVMSGATSMGMGVGGSLMLIAGGRIIPIAGFSVFFLIAAGLTTAGAVLFLTYFHVPRGEIADLAVQSPST